MTQPAGNQTLINRITQSDSFYSFVHSPGAIIAAVITLICVLAAIFAPYVAPHDPFDLASIDLMDSRLPPYWIEGGTGKYLLGTDVQGRDILSLIIFGMRISLIAGGLSMVFAVVLGVTLGLISGFAGGKTDTIIMRLADMQLSFPAILIALLIDGVARGFMPREMHDQLALYVIVLSIGLANWVHFARTVRSLTMVEKQREYVQAAKILNVSSPEILWRHILVNVAEPVLVIATVGFGIAIIMEATLSFLGVGLPPSEPSLGTLIRTGNDYLFSGDWWMTIFPGMVLMALVLSINLLGDWMRDALNPTLR
ncbi:MAG: ABC transporter permease [Rhodospirillaceae bacterium]|jgi:peptide/nickel transport system permease protein|nr:ABC transporter permease [Rhodospirillales bacterium]MBT4934749.1 ABC transporter permease [Rhodospirillaceae bacterium]MBT5243950.1 ABC transporter permease [Rhodospirillaceae bacterium]MBT5560931.1 ABC transporter permease [Rhodospirillaceae bacterium]MBT6242462.1 ABC transporter permease [Rhodospirillaceae bacterium]